MVGRHQQGSQQEGGAPAGAPEGGPHQGPLPSVAHNKVLDRQIRLWGLEAQKKLLEARVLVVGLSAVNVEASKDLALAEASKLGLESIASFVSFSAIPPEAVGCMFTSTSGDSQHSIENLVKQYSCVCVAAEVLPTHTLGPKLERTCGLLLLQGGLAAACRKCGVRDLDPKVDPAIYAVLAILRCESNQPGSRRSLGSIDPLDEEEAAKIEAAAAGVLAAEGVNLSPSIQRAIRDLAFGYNQQTNATSAVVGGLLEALDSSTDAVRPQEVRKYITKEQKAVPNVVVFDSYSSCAAREGGAQEGSSTQVGRRAGGGKSCSCCPQAKLSHLSKSSNRSAVTMRLPSRAWAAPLLLLLSSEVSWSEAGGQGGGPGDLASGDLTPDARLVTENVELLAWYLQNDRLAVAHVAMCLLEGPHEEVSKAIIEQCNGDFDFIRSSVKDFIIGLPRSPTPVSLGESGPSVALRNALRTAWKMAEQESAPIGVHHLYLSLIEIPAFQKIIVKSGCDLKIIKRAIVEQFKGRQRATVPTSFLDMVGEKQKVSDLSISQYGVDLSFMAQQGLLAPVIGREEEIDRMAQILSRRMTKAPILLGEPGVGKTAVIEGLAQRIVEGAVPDSLKNRRIFSLDLLSLTAGSSMRGEFEKRMKDVISYLQQHVNEVILFVDEIHTIIGAGKAAGSMDATLAVVLSKLTCGSQSFHRSLARRSIVICNRWGFFVYRLIGATTLTEYKLHMEKDAAFCRRFQKIVVEAPSKERTLGILRKVKANYEKHHKMTISDEVVSAVVEMSDKYIKRRSFPDKALDLLDEACSSRRVLHNTRLAELRTMITEAKEGKRTIPEDELRGYEEELAKLTTPIDGHTDPDHLAVTLEDVARILSRWTGIPLGKMTEDELSRIMKLSEVLSKRVIGQDEAVTAVANAIRNHRAGLTEDKKPIGAFLFLGSSGVGKTELAKALAEEIFHSEKNLIRLDMVEYQEAHSISRLIGPPPGYMGNDEGGQLTEAVRQKPYSVVLFDEVENAHKNLWSLLLPMLDEGHLTDTKNVRVDFSNTIIIMTSNIGQQYILDGFKEARAMSQGAATPLAQFNKDKGSLERFAMAKAGAKAAGSFQQDQNQNKGATASAVQKKKSEQWNTGNTPQEVLAKMRQKVMQEVLGYFKPQVIGRMTKIIIFEPLTDSAMRGVLNLMFSHLTRELKKKGITLEVTDSAKAFILERAWSHKFGGRRMAKYIEKYITAKIAPLVLSAKLKRGDKAQLKRAANQPNQLNLIICEEDEKGECKPGTKHGRVLVVQAAKAIVGEGEEEDPMI
ncbi:hypothetical protein ACSSS7_005286 [Eimeria intestinalis]